jgi:Tol biopolymer transport system component
VHTVDVATRASRPVTPAERHSYAPTWSPTGDTVLVDQIQGVHHGLATTPATTTTATALALQDGFAYDASWRR